MPKDMVEIPSGAFAMGNCMTGIWGVVNGRTYYEGNENELPVHTVMISSFYMDRYEVAKEKWDKVYNWATNSGYVFDNPGKGKAPNHPVHSVNWYDCVKWCNARSEKEGLTPCYYLNASKMGVYRTGQVDLDNECVNWTTNGYRLPTEAEWEKAARGGLAGHRFPWGDTISHRQANYNSDGQPDYDASLTKGCHWRFYDQHPPYTSPVGYFKANGYGLYDMAGNVDEWCWDWYDKSYYLKSPGNDPHGPTNGWYRVFRGGDWYVEAYFMRLTFRYELAYQNEANDLVGFRCVRRP